MDEDKSENGAGGNQIPEPPEPDKKPKKKKHILRGVLLSLLALVVVAALAAIGYAYSLYGKYYTGEVGISDRPAPHQTEAPPETFAVGDVSYAPDETITDYIPTTSPAPATSAPSTATTTTTTTVASATASASASATTTAKPAATTTTTPRETLPVMTAAPAVTTTASTGTTAAETFRSAHYDQYYEPGGTNTPIYKKAQEDPNVLNIILLGRDTRDAKNDRGRTDLMVVLSYNKKANTVKLLSLQRDSLVPIEGYSWNRLNTAYFFGGTGLCVNTINDLFGLDIQNYVTIDFDGIVAVIDKLGGVSVNITEEESAYYKKEGGMDIPAGYTLLTGKMALLHAGNRHSDASSDIGRARRQRDIIIAVYEKMRAMSLSDALSLIDYGSTRVATNMKLDTIVSLATGLLSGGMPTITSSSMPFSGTYSSVWYNRMLVLSLDIERNAGMIHDFIYGK